MLSINFDLIRHIKLYKYLSERLGSRQIAGKVLNIFLKQNIDIELLDASLDYYKCLFSIEKSSNSSILSLDSENEKQCICPSCIQLKLARFCFSNDTNDLSIILHAAGEISIPRIFETEPKKIDRPKSGTKLSKMKKKLSKIRESFKTSSMRTKAKKIRKESIKVKQEISPTPISIKNDQTGTEEISKEYCELEEKFPDLIGDERLSILGKIYENICAIVSSKEPSKKLEMICSLETDIIAASNEECVQIFFSKREIKSLIRKIGRNKLSDFDLKTLKNYIYNFFSREAEKIRQDMRKKLLEMRKNKNLSLPESNERKQQIIESQNVTNNILRIIMS
ncbi:MAG: hypothetical protein MHPSP_000910 [Paramarteilia canceri]